MALRFLCLASMLLVSAQAERFPVPDSAAAVELAPGETLMRAVVLPAPRAVEGLAADGWSLVASVDVLNCDPNALVELELHDASGALLQRARLRRSDLAAAAEGKPQRLAALPKSPGAITGQVTFHVRVTGGRARISELTLERHHSAPTEALRGKENGVLGPDLLGCGMLGFTALTEHEHRSFVLLGVTPDGPAAKAGLKQGDLVFEVDGAPLPTSSLKPGWDWFHDSHEARLGRALERALTEGPRSVELTVGRVSETKNGALRRVKLRVPLEGRLGSDFPLRGIHADALRRDLVRWAVEHAREKGGWPGVDAVNPALGALGLMATGDAAHAPLVAKTIDYLLTKHPRPVEMRGLAYWTIAFQGILLCEHVLAGPTPDERALPWIRAAIEWLPTTMHPSAFGMPAFGHGPDGLPYEEKALMAPAAHLLVFDALARRCGVESKVWESIAPYVRHSWSDPAQGGHGGMGYNGSYRDKDEFWSRSGLVALAEVLRGDREGMAPKLAILMAERHPWMLNSHAYGEPGAALGLLALSVVDRAAFERILGEWRWRFLCAWEPGYGLRYSSPHMGAPYMGEESVVNLGYLLLLHAAVRPMALTTAAAAD